MIFARPFGIKPVSHYRCGHPHADGRGWLKCLDRLPMIASSPLPSSQSSFLLLSPGGTGNSHIILRHSPDHSRSADSSGGSAILKAFRVTNKGKNVNALTGRLVVVRFHCRYRSPPSHLFIGVVRAKGLKMNRQLFEGGVR
jgi:hypothetical protein